MRNENVVHALAELFVSRGHPDSLRSDNGSEFTAKPIRQGLEAVGMNTAFIDPGSPRENGYSESFDGKLRNELPNGEIFCSLRRPRW
jgi:transposase InsO family protein